jgi:photosystem II stability/assembly factor-like uncharacterized protein
MIDDTGRRDRPRSGSASRICALALACFFGCGSAISFAQRPGWENLGPLAPADVNALAIDFSTPTTLYAAVGGTVYKTTDGGDHWSRSGHGIDFGGLDDTVTGLFVDPQDSVSVFASTTDSFIFHSGDASGTWTRWYGPAVGNVYVAAVAIVPGEPAAAYLATSESLLLRTTDSGGTWTQLPVISAGVPITSLAVDPVNYVRLLAGTSDSGLFVSTDSGATWVQDLQDFPAQAWINEIAFDPTESGHILVSGSSGTYWSMDNGASFHESDRSMPYAESFAFSSEAGSTRSYALFMQQIRESSDHGSTWRSLSLGDRPTYVSALAVDAHRPGRLCVGTQGFPGRSYGVLGSTDDGGSWQERDDGLRFSPFGIYALAESGRGTLFASPIYGGMIVSRNGGASWSSLDAFPEGGAFFVAIKSAADDPDIIYAISDLNVFRSSDDGVSWSVVYASPVGGIESLEVDPRDSATLYAFIQLQPFKSTDGGASWSQLTGGLPQNLNGGYFAVAPSDDSTVYMAAGDVYRSTDSGATWADLTASDYFPNFGTIAVDLNDPRVVYAAWRDLEGSCPSSRLIAEGRVFPGIAKSSDGGNTWVNADIRALDRNRLGTFATIVVDPSDTSVLYVSAFDSCYDGGSVAQSTDSGLSWHPFDAGLADARALDLIIEGRGGRLYAGTGKGVFAYPPLSAVAPVSAPGSVPVSGRR